MTLQPNTKAGRIRRELDADPYRTNREISKAIGKVPGHYFFEGKIRHYNNLLSASYIAEVRRKFKYPKANDQRPTAKPELPIEAYDWI